MQRRKRKKEDDGQELKSKKELGRRQRAQQPPMHHITAQERKKDEKNDTKPSFRNIKYVQAKRLFLFPPKCMLGIINKYKNKKLGSSVLATSLVTSQWF